MNTPAEKDRLAILNLQDALVDDLMAMSDDELMADTRELGLDVEAESTHVRQLLARAAGKAKMQAAKSDMAQYRSRGGSIENTATPNPANDLHQARLTRAARNGTEQSEADIKSVAEDLAELSAFEDNPNQ